MNSIHLNNLKFFAHHGYHDEEGVTGTDFEVSVSIVFEAPEKIITLPQTINYVEVYDVIKAIFQRPTKLLESIAEDICENVYLLDDRIRTINITITKLHPPITNFIGSVGVSLSKSY
jgi:dihydroneopterin aldolase